MGIKTTLGGLVAALSLGACTIQHVHREQHLQRDVPSPEALHVGYQEVFGQRYLTVFDTTTKRMYYLVSEKDGEEEGLRLRQKGDLFY